MAKIRSAVPQYLTQNQSGTYVFQARVPTFITRNNPHSKTLVRCSLKTKDFREAIRRSRAKWLAFDCAVSSYHDPVDFNHQIDQILDNPNGPSTLLTPKTDIDPIANSTHPQSPEDASLSSMVQSFIQYKKDTGARAASINWYTQKAELFTTILTALNGECPTISQINTDLIKKYTTIIQRYPRHASMMRKIRDMPDQERTQLLLNHDRDSLSAMGIPLISFNTVDHHLTAAREIIRC